MFKECALIIDDDKGSRRIAQYIFQMRNVETREAANGEEGLPVLLNEDIDFLILDWNMPVLNGQDTLLLTDSVLKQLALHGVQPEKAKKIKTILYTSCRLEEMVVPLTKHFQLLGYVSKSWTLDIQKRKFNSFIRQLREGSAA